MLQPQLIRLYQSAACSLPHYKFWKEIPAAAFTSLSKSTTLQGHPPAFLPLVYNIYFFHHVFHDVGSRQCRLPSREKVSTMIWAFAKTTSQQGPSQQHTVAISAISRMVSIFTWFVLKRTFVGICYMHDVWMLAQFWVLFTHEGFSGWQSRAACH
jgi:hypothetical protein